MAPSATAYVAQMSDGASDRRAKGPPFCALHHLPISSAMSTAGAIGFRSFGQPALLPGAGAYAGMILEASDPVLCVDFRAAASFLNKLRVPRQADYAAFLAGHPDLVSRACRLARVTEANRAAAALLGGDPSSLLGPMDYLFRSAPELAYQLVLSQLLDGNLQAHVGPLHTFNGRERYVAISVAGSASAQAHDLIVITLKDVTERIEMDARIRQLEADLALARTSCPLEDISETIAHEIMQPLAAIGANANTAVRLLQRSEPDLAQVQSATEMIASAAKRAASIVRRVRATACRRGFEFAPLDLNGVVRESLAAVGHELSSRGVEVIADLAELRPVVGDSIQLQQVLTNLVVNAAQAMDARRERNCVGGSRLALLTRPAPDGAVMLEVRDNGPGIAFGDLPHIFDRFFTTKVEGMGIGLAICRSIIVAHGGAIEAMNCDEGGAVFRIILPAAPAA